MSDEANGKNSLVGEFLLALARAPEPIQEAIIVQGLKKFLPFAPQLINPYPMLSHMVKIMNLRGPADSSSESGSSGS